MNKHIILLLLLAPGQAAFTQSIGINTDASPPHASAMLDVMSANKGIMIPRVSLISETDITTIVNPATSLLVFNTNNALPDGIGFHYWNGNRWTRLLTNSNAVNLIGSTAWGLNGNTGADTNFIGTTSNRALVFKTNNILSGKIDPGPNNVFFGQYAGAGITNGNNNAFFGHQAGQSNTTGGDNVFAGYNAGNENTTGLANVFVGQDAGRRNVSGNMNVFVGEDAGIENTSGSYNIFLGNGAGRTNTYPSGNVAIGRDALSSNEAGYSNVVIGDRAMPNATWHKNVVAIGDSALYNILFDSFFPGTTAVGSKALFSSTGGLSNTAFGFEAMYGNISGSSNVAVGMDALRNVIDGHGNTAVGNNAMINSDDGSLNVAIGLNALWNNDGDDNTAVGTSAMYDFAGDGNTAVGYSALDPISFTSFVGDSNTAVGILSGPILTGLNNTTCIGNRANVTSSHTMVFGNNRVTRWAFGIPTTNAQHALEVGEVFGDGNGAYLTQGGAWTNASDVHKKEDISLITTSDILSKILSLPISRWKYKGGEEYHIGPMAQDFYKIFNVGVDDKGISTIDPAGVSLAGIQALAKENEKLVVKNEELQRQIIDLVKRVEVLEQKTAAQ
jgi:hypothetical protein